MGLRDPLPGSVSWITRTIGYSVGAVAIAVAWYVAGNVLVVKHYADCMELPSQRGASKPTALESARRWLPASTGGPAWWRRSLF